MISHDFAGWYKSSRSGATQNCVEIGSAPGLVGVRDTKDRNGGTLAFDRAAWTAFVATIKEDTKG